MESVIPTAPKERMKMNSDRERPASRRVSTLFGGTKENLSQDI
jgi:hypothetical protein